MADAEHRLDFLEGRVGVFLDVGLELCGVELAPFTPARFRGERALLGGRQIPVNRATSQIKPPGSLGLGATRVEEFDHPLPQVQRISFHAQKPIRLCANVNMKCYSISEVVVFESHLSRWGYRFVASLLCYRVKICRITSSIGTS